MAKDQYMTMEEYIKNPMGKKNAVYSNREMYRELYKKKLDTILTRESGKIKYELFKNATNTKYYAYLKVPSEVVEGFYYDVIIEMSQPNGLQSLNISLKKYNVRFYSNDPSFVFTYAYAFNKTGMFFDELDQKMSKRALKEKAKEKNPTAAIGYVKSIFFAYLYMEQKGLFNKLLYVKDYSFSYFEREVMPADQKIALRQEAGAEAGKKKKASNNNLKEKSRRDNLLAKYQDETNIGTTSFVNKVKTIPMGRNVTKTKKTHRIGR